MEAVGFRFRGNASDTGPDCMRSFRNDTGVDDFAMYDIKFPFGTFTLYGTQIEPE